MVRRCAGCGQFNEEPGCEPLCALCTMERLYGVERLGKFLIWRDVKKLLGVTPHDFEGKRKVNGHYCMVPREAVHKYWQFNGVKRTFPSEEAAVDFCLKNKLTNRDGLVIRKGNRRGVWWVIVRRAV